MNGPRIYNLFPTLVGPVARWSAHLDRIAAMHFDWIYVNPFTATGASGSLYAVKDYRALSPASRGEGTLGDDEILRAFTRDAAARGLRVMVDLVINHTAEDSPLVTEHPDWYAREADGSIAHPFAVDSDDATKKVVWGDLAELDYSPRPALDALVAYVSGVARHYASLGFAGFRCDAAYKVPGDVWRRVIDAVRVDAPSAVFVAETLGGPDDEVRQLGRAGFDFFFNSSKWWDFRQPWLLEQYEAYRHIAPSVAFPESHDTPRLAAELPDGADVEAEYRFRYLVAASISSGVMMPIGYEFGFSRPLDVVGSTPDQWETPRFDLSGFIGAVNAMKAGSGPLQEEGPINRLAGEREGVVALLRASEDAAAGALVLVNPDQTTAFVPVARLAALGLTDLEDLSAGVARTRTAPNGTIEIGPRDVRIFATPDARLSSGGPPAGLLASEARPVVIEGVTPEIDAGRFAAKGIVGEHFVVEADLFREGHDALAGVLRYREAGATGWRETPMRPLVNDRYRGTFELACNGRYEYTLEAWPDAFATWHHDTQKKVDAGQAIALEVVEGRALVEAARDRAHGAERETLDVVVRALAGADESSAAGTLLGADLASLVARVPDRSRATSYPRVLEVFADRPLAQFASWYEFFPRSQTTDATRHGTFDDAAARLPAIAAMGFDVVYLPPIHPIGHAFRKGKNNSLEPGPLDPGSPWAIGNEDGGHTAVEPKLGTLADFDRFVARATSLGLEVALDYALQCSPDHPYVRDHPEWFVVRPDGSIKYAENPPKKYQDIVNFNWFGPAAPELWNALRDIVEFWIGHGVRTFRVDNPHTKPFAYWEWMIRDVKSRHPEVVFLAEAFTRPKVMAELAKAGFSQSYTYFTWRTLKWELEQYLTELATGPGAAFFRPNFWPNTPDILSPYLQTGGHAAFRIRLALAALLSSLYGIYSGFELAENAALPGREEYLDSEKYEIRVRDYDAPGNLNLEIGRWNAIRRAHPALQDWRNVVFHTTNDDGVIAFSKAAGDDALFAIVLLDPLSGRETDVQFPVARFGIGTSQPFETEELLSGSRETWTGEWHRVGLGPERNPVILYRIDANVIHHSEDETR